MHVLFIYPQFLRTKYILFAFPGGHASVECTHPDTRAELNSTSCFQGIADVALAQSLRWRKVGGVIIPDDTSLCFCTMLQLQKVEGPNRNPAGFYFGHRVWEWRAFGCQRVRLSRNWEARINMNNCCSIPPQLRSLYCKCCLNAYPFTPFVSWTFIITSLLYSSGENEQYTYYRWILSFLFFTMMWLLLRVIIE